MKYTINNCALFGKLRKHTPATSTSMAHSNLSASVGSDKGNGSRIIRNVIILLHGLNCELADIKLTGSFTRLSLLGRGPRRQGRVRSCC